MEDTLVRDLQTAIVAVFVKHLDLPGDVLFLAGHAAVSGLASRSGMTDAEVAALVTAHLVAVRGFAARSDIESAICALAKVIEDGSIPP